MGENNKKNNEGEQKKEEQNKKKDNVTVVLKADLHCEGCATKVLKCIRSFGGVDTVTTGDGQKITVVGNVDPVKLREKVVQKTHKSVELISPQPKKDNDKENSGNGGENGKNKDSKENNEKKPKEKEIPVTTAVFKMNLHCDGCIQKLYKTVTKTKGYSDMKIDTQKDLVSVTGAIDMKALAEVLSKQLKRVVEIVPPKKDGEKKDGGGGGGDEKAEGNNNNNNNNNNKQMQAQVAGGYPYPFMSGPVFIGDLIHYSPSPYPVYQDSQIFSDENPNGCSVM